GYRRPEHPALAEGEGGAPGARRVRERARTRLDDAGLAAAVGDEVGGVPPAQAGGRARLDAPAVDAEQTSEIRPRARALDDLDGVRRAARAPRERASKRDGSLNVRDLGRRVRPARAPAVLLRKRRGRTGIRKSECARQRGRIGLGLKLSLDEVA